MATSSEGNENVSSVTLAIPEIFGATTCIIPSLDQYKMEEEMAAMESDDVKVILNNDRTFRLEGEYINIEKAIEQLVDLRLKKHASKDTAEENKEQTEENKEQTSNNCDAAIPKERKRVLKQDLTPSDQRVDLSLSQKVPIEQHVWYYLERKHPKEVNGIAEKHLCISRVVYESSNDGISLKLEVAPYAQANSNEADKCVNDAVEEFAQLYRKASEPGIVKKVVELPLSFNQDMLQRLIAELEKVDVFFLKSDDSFLIGPEACMAEAKQKVLDFTSGHNNNPEKTQPNNDFGQAKGSTADHVQPMYFKTHGGLAVHVSKGDLVRQSLDAIVNPANEYLGNGGGAARAIAKAAGDYLQWECKDFIRKHGKLGLALVMHTSAGKLQPKIKYVIHTVGPRKSEAKDDEELLGLVRLTVFNCLCYANDELNIHSIAIPAISSGIFGVPIEIVGRASYEALKMFDNYYASSKKKCLREIHFLNNDEETVSNMKRIFQYSLNDNHESSVDPEQRFNATELLDAYAEVVGRKRIEITTHDNCFTRAFATALQKDFRSKLDWHQVNELIRREVEDNKDHYAMFRINGEQTKQWSWADVVKNPMNAVDAAFANIFGPLNGDKGDKGYDPDVWISAAASALQVQIVLVQLTVKQEPVERNFKPRLSEKDDTVYIAYHSCGHYHFDALVKKSSVNGKNVSKSVTDAPAETQKNEFKDMPQANASDVAGKKDAKENTSEMAAKNSSKPDGDRKDVKKDDKKDDKKEDDDDNNCIICMDVITDKKELPCKHKFCRECIDEYFSRCQPKCPSCGKVFGTLKGDQPKGTMTTKEISYRLNGYKDCEAIEINYSFNDGIQEANHPNPGAPYRGTHRTAYLPANKEGREVLRLLKRAFDAKLVFTIGRSNTTGQENVVIWNDVHHKTSTTGQYGYPDPTYLKRVTEELAAKGIQ